MLYWKTTQFNGRPTREWKNKKIYRASNTKSHIFRDTIRTVLKSRSYGKRWIYWTSVKNLFHSLIAFFESNQFISYSNHSSKPFEFAQLRARYEEIQAHNETLKMNLRGRACEKRTLMKFIITICCRFRF